MKNATQIIALTFVLAAAAVNASPAFAVSSGNGNGNPAVCDCRGGGGGFPGPFDGSNLRVELSDGDMYALVGRVVFFSSSNKGSPSLPYFEIDLREHPWLANTRRKARPFYPLMGSLQFWRGMEGQVIELSAQAQGTATLDIDTGTAHYEISLLPLAVYVPHCGK